MGGINMRLHVVTDKNGCPIRFFMIAGQVSEYTGAAALLNSLPEAEWLLAPCHGLQANHCPLPDRHVYMPTRGQWMHSVKLLGPRPVRSGSRPSGHRGSAPYCPVLHGSIALRIPVTEAVG